MPKNRKDLISQLINEGFTHRTLSSFSDNQIKVLGSKLLGEGYEEEIKSTKEKLANLTIAKAQQDAEELTTEVDEEDGPVDSDIKVDRNLGYGISKRKPTSRNNKRKFYKNC